MTPYKPLMDVQQVTRPLEIRETSPVRKKQEEVLLVTRCSENCYG